MASGSVDDRLAVTAAGYAQLAAELETLRTEGRRDVVDRLRDARDDGDLADNPTLYETLEEQALLEQRIATLETQLATAWVAPPPTDGIAGIGNVVRVRDTKTGEEALHELVGAIEADVGNGRVSIDAPVGRALVGRRAGERVPVSTPRGTTTLEILEVSHQAARAA
jgi:transcription elongation factor GreA